MNKDIRISSPENIAICVGGVPGSGKTTLLKTHVEMETQDIQVTGSSIIKTIIAPSSVHEFDSWKPEQRDAVRQQSILELRRLRQQCAGRMLVDGHFTLRNRSSGELESIFTPEDRGFFNALILIHPQPEFVLARREEDQRCRRTESIEEIAAHIEFEQIEGRRLANEMGVPLLELDECDLLQRLHIMASFLDMVSVQVKQ